MRYINLQGIRFLFACMIITLSHESFSQSVSFWRDTDDSKVFSAGRHSVPVSFRTVELDLDNMRQLLNTAPAEFTDAARQSAVAVTLPMPDGSMEDFIIEQTDVLAPGLAARYPQIRTYVGVGTSDKYAYARLDVTLFGFHAMVLSPRGDVFIDPVSNDNDKLYISYYKHDLRGNREFTCGLSDNESLEFESIRKRSEPAHRSSGEELRTYRLALSCTGEYATKKGGTVSGALSGMTTSVNRVTGVYEQEFAIRLQLIENDTVLIFLNSSTDPFSNNNGGAMLDQNQDVIDDLIGTANYDIGHVFSTGGGGIAHLGAVCRASFKAQGVTGLSNPVGDAFDIDYVAHEMGHQFGANHTFNSTTGACGGGNRNGGTAFEPGSGSTIMAYAGICGTTNDLQPHSDPFFHTGSYDEVLDYVTYDFGADCPVITVTDNSAPEVTVGSDFTIPISTPFRLEGAASDPEGSPVTYMWEEVDKGPGGDWDEPSGNAPCFRSFKADTVPFRYFPKISTIVSNYPASVKGEILPDYGRTLNFRLTARDHQLNGGGSTYADDKVTLTVSSAAGPFEVIYPNTDINWPINTAQVVTWDVSNTDVAPVNCTAVDILLSIDGGFTYPITLATAVPNNGEATVTMPNDVSLVGIDDARVMVRASANVFFDISNANFTITNNVGAPLLHDVSEQIHVFPNPVSDVMEVMVEGLQDEQVTLLLHDVCGKRIMEKEMYPRLNTFTFTVSMKELSSGLYFLELRSENVKGFRKVVKE